MAEAVMVEDLRTLLVDVVQSRADQAEARRGSPRALVSASWIHLKALEAYALALDHQGWPLPPKMRQEIRLQRSLCGAFR
jgi:hypothetical protein